jgi:hypothetical protein
MANQLMKPVTWSNAAGYAGTFVTNLDPQTPGNQQGGRGENGRSRWGWRGNVNTPKKKIDCFNCREKKSLCKQASLSSESLREETFVSIDEYSDALVFTMKIYTKAEEVSAKRAYEVLQTRGFPLIMEEIHLVEDDIFYRMPEISRDDQSGLWDT